MPSTSLQNTTNGSKPKPRINKTTRSLPTSKSSSVTSNVVPLVDHSRNPSPFSDSKHFVCSTCHKCIFNTNHDACITKLLKEVNSSKVKSHKTRNSNKLVEQKSHTQQPSRQIFTRHMFSPNKSSVVYKKTAARFDLRWKPTGKILNNVGLRWVPIGKILTSSTSKADSESTHANMTELESLFCPLFDEYFNGENQVVSMSSAVTTTDASDKCQQQLDSTSSTSTLATTVTVNGNFDM
ncbi:hypothetical protein Tco_0285280 [Tanacetum coccineum]